MPPDSQPPRDVLSSWKEISSHFGVSVRSVQLWEEERGLPVHRMPGIKGRVYAYEDELDAWAKRTSGGEEPEPSPAPPSQRGRPILRWAAAAVLIAGAIGLSWWMWPATPVPSSWAIQGRTLVVKDRAGAVIWTHEFPGTPVPIWADGGRWSTLPQTRPWIGDLDGDGKREVLFTYVEDGSGTLLSQLFCFEAGGKIRWKYKPGRHVSTRTESFPPPFFVRMILLVPSETGRPPVLIVVGNHSIYYPSQVAALSPRGRIQREYWHSGHINESAVADLDGNGRPELYLAANHNATKTTGLIALDPMDFGGASHESNPDYQIQGMGEPRELARVLLPSPELTRQLHWPTEPAGFRIQDGRLFLSVRQAYKVISGAFDGLQVFYQFGPGLKLLGIEYPWTFETILSELVRSGRAKPYDLDADLEKLKRIQVITPWRGGASGK